MSASLFEDVRGGYGEISGIVSEEIETSDITPLYELKIGDIVYGYDDKNNKIIKYNVKKSAFSSLGRKYYIKISDGEKNLAVFIGSSKTLKLVKDNCQNYFCSDYNCLWKFIYKRTNSYYEQYKKYTESYQKIMNEFVKNNPNSETKFDSPRKEWRFIMKGGCKIVGDKDLVFESPFDLSCMKIKFNKILNFFGEGTKDDSSGQIVIKNYKNCCNNDFIQKISSWFCLVDKVCKSDNTNTVQEIKENIFVKEIIIRFPFRDKQFCDKSYLNCVVRSFNEYDIVLGFEYTW